MNRLSIFDLQKDPNDVRIECDNTQQEQTINIILSVITHLLLAWKARYFVSDTAIDILLDLLHYFVSIIQFTIFSLEQFIKQKI